MDRLRSLASHTAKSIDAYAYVQLTVNVIEYELRSH